MKNKSKIYKLIVIRVPQLPYQSPSTVSESSSNFMSSKRNESMPIRSRLNGRRKFLRDIDLP